MSGFGRSGRERVKEERWTDMPSYGREMGRYAQLRKRDGQICPVKEEI